MRRLVWILVLALMTAAGSVRGELKEGDHVAIIGDSITEQRQYSVMIEAYLLACQPAPRLQTTQFGWGGETALGFSRRIDDCLLFQPTVATTCYGMNDGGYARLSDDRRKTYREKTLEIVQKLKAGGVRFIVVGSPGIVDPDTYKRGAGAEVYNQTLAELRDIAREVAEAEGVGFANVHDVMLSVATRAKAKYGPEYHLAGGDGVHPAANGHLVMAYAFLKALGANGDIGTITVDLAGGKAEATAGHRVVSFADGQLQLQSTRYPFCFSGDPAQTSATSGVIEFFPFNDELNRLRLVVTGGEGERIRVTWGEGSKEFSAAELAEGINLAGEFIDNPFSAPFAELMQAVRRQQTAEVDLIKHVIRHLGLIKAKLPHRAAALDEMMAELMADHQSMRDAAAAAVVPVEHTLRLEVVR